MSYLRGSANYVWCTTSVLGKGATGAVFQGVSKHDGEPVAVKTFNQLSHMRPHEVQMREFEVLKKVKHENIVKLLAIEEEQDGRGKVIVMELCTGGSLFNILDDPENMYGLEEDEFLLVVEHLSAGMKHLRDLNLVHRDLKPGNIMKFVAEDGKIVYKLTDFGAARELEEDQEFVSLYGTEEYLHPDLYERAVLRKPVGKAFSASVDLWSIGVTLYHVATGSLPFRPYGGRKNKEMMYYITTKKEEGVISGCQTTENGPIEWKRDMPSSCQLSTGLKILITPLLAGLMEVDPRKRLSFESFFAAVQNILSRTRVKIFFVNKIQSLRVYMSDEDNSLSNFQCLLMEQTDISPENQILIHKDCALQQQQQTASDKRGKSSSTVPDTDDTPIVLCHRENNNVALEWDTKDLPKFTAFPNLVNVENDASLAKHICGIGYTYRRRVEKICRAVTLINEAVKTINKVIISKLVSVLKEIAQLQTIINQINQQLSMMLQFHKACQSFVNGLPVPTNKVVGEQIENLGQIADQQHEEFKVLQNQLLVLEQPLKQLYSRFVENDSLLSEWSESTVGIKNIARAYIKAGSHVTKLRDSWQHLLRDRATRNLTYNDEQFHILERIKMQEKSKCLSELLNEECQLTIVKLTEVLSDWYKTAQASFIQSEILAKDLTQFEDTLYVYMIHLKESVDCYQTGVNTLMGNVPAYNSKEPCNTTVERGGESSNHKSVVSANGIIEIDSNEHNDVATAMSNTSFPPSGRKSSNRNRKDKEYIKTFNRGLKELTNIQEEVWSILKENAELVNQFQTLTLSVLSPCDGNGGVASYDSNTSSTRNSLSKNDSSDLSGKSNGSI